MKGKSMSEKSKVRIQSYISQNLKDTLDKYCIKNNTNISSVTNEALLEYFKLKPIEDNLEFLISIIENTVHKEMDSKMNRIVALTAKTTKSTFSSQFLLIFVLTYIFSTKNETEFIKEKLKLAEEIGYKATKMPLSETIEEILPKDFNFEKM